VSPIFEFNLFVLVVDTLIGASAIIFLMHWSSHHHMLFVRVGLWLGAIGLFGQAYRNAQYILYSESPTDNSLVYWVLKDAALWVIIVCAILYSIKKSRGVK